MDPVSITGTYTMFNLIKKLLLVKEIRSKSGELHFQRYRLLQTPWFSIYVHYIAKSDEDKDPHNHPWRFSNLILSGGYMETLYIPDANGNKEYNNTLFYTRFKSNIQFKLSGEEFHQIKLFNPTWTLVITGPKKKEDWGYLTDTGFVGYKEYRKLKNNV